MTQNDNPGGAHSARIPSPFAPKAQTMPQSAAEDAPLVSFHAKGSDYFCILLGNFILKLLTLGIYHFWGKVKIREYLWKNTYILGEPLEYTGTGKELLVSFLIVVPLFLGLTFLGGLLAEVHFATGQALTFLLFISLFHFASYRALRFRLSRTRWRGIRGNLSGSALKYALQGTLFTFISLATLGLAGPWIIARMASLQLNNAWFGNRRLAFSGTAKELAGPYYFLWASGALFIGFVLFSLYRDGLFTPEFFDDPEYAIESMGPYFPLILAGTIYGMLAGFFIIGTLFRVVFLRWLFEGMSFGELRPRSSLRSLNFVGVRVTNVLLTIVTLGIGYAWAYLRELSAVLNSVDYVGRPDFNSLMQDTLAAPKTGEGLLEALDVDIAF